MFNNPFLKKDPLLEAVKTAQAEGAMRRAAEAIVNEEFGVYSRKALIREELAAYDARLEAAYVELKEGKKLANKDYDGDGERETPKDEVWGSRLRAARAAGKLEEEPVDYLGKSTVTQDRDPKATSYDKTLPQTYPGGATSDAAGQRVSNAKASVTPVKEGVTAPKDWSEKRHPNKNAVTKAPVPGVSIAEEKKKWIQSAIKHPGALHEELHVPQGKKIPAGKLARAEHSKNPVTARRARLAETLRGMSKGKK